MLTERTPGSFRSECANEMLASRRSSSSLNALVGREDVSAAPGDRVAVTITGSTWNAVSASRSETSVVPLTVTSRTAAAYPTLRATIVYRPSGMPVKLNVPSAEVFVVTLSSARLTMTFAIGAPAESTTRP